MRNVILSLPRCGSAWLAAYFGYLHDPMMYIDPVKGIGRYSVVDTGAAVDPGAAYAKYHPDRAVVLVGHEDRITQSLQALGFPVSRELVLEWSDRLHNFAIGKRLPLFHYGDFFGNTDLGAAEDLCAALGEDFDTLRWANQREVKVTHDIKYYTTERYENYVRWLRAS